MVNELGSNRKVVFYKSAYGGASVVVLLCLLSQSCAAGKGSLPKEISEGKADYPGWGTPKLIETDDAGDVSMQRIAMDAAGNALAVWVQSDGIRSNIWSNRFVSGQGWGTPMLIEDDNAGDATLPRLAVNARGNALAVWQQSDGTRYNIWARRYVPETGWESPQLVETDNVGHATGPEIAMDATGNAIAIWRQYHGPQFDIWANRYATGTGWDTPQLLISNPGNEPNPSIAMDVIGNAMVVWQQQDSVRSRIWANHYVEGKGWDGAQPIDTDHAGKAGYPKIAISVSRDAIAVWHQSDGVRQNIWANRFVAGKGWSTARVIETDETGDNMIPQIVMDAGGNALVVWRQLAGNRMRIWANRYAVETDWGVPELIQADPEAKVYGSDMALDASGNAMVVWSQGKKNSLYFSNLWVNQYRVGGGWGHARRIEDHDRGQPGGPQIAVDGTGNTMLIWKQPEGRRASLWANRFECCGTPKTDKTESDGATTALSEQLHLLSNQDVLLLKGRVGGATLVLNKPIIGANLQRYTAFDNSVVFISNVPEHLVDQYTNTVRELVAEQSRADQIILAPHNESQAGIACVLAPFRANGKMALELIVIVFDREKAKKLMKDSPNTRGLQLVVQTAAWYAVTRVYPEGNLDLERGVSDTDNLTILQRLVNGAFGNFMMRGKP